MGMHGERVEGLLAAQDEIEGGGKWKKVKRERKGEEEE